MTREPATGLKEESPNLPQGSEDAASDPERQAEAQNKEYGSRARFGVIALTVRAIFQNILVLVANVYLARVLSPADYGIFAILQFAVQVLKQVGDGGLAAALIQKHEQPDNRELSSIWWFQLALGAGLLLLSVASASLLPMIWKDLPEGAAWLFPLLTLSLIFTMLRAVPFLLLERQVRFGMIGTLEFVGSVAYYGASMLLATWGYGSTALVLATVLQAALISLLVNILQPWRPQLVFDWQRVKHTLGFGLSFQGSNAVAFLNGAIAPLLAGIRLGPSGLGLVQFAQNTAWFPTAFVGVVRRVAFPYLSRLQGEPRAFARAFDRAILSCAIPVFFFLGLFFGAAPHIVELIYSEKWLPAVPALYVYSVGITINFFAWIGSAALEALGKPKRLLRIVALSTTVNWIACLIAVFVSPTPFSFAIGFCTHMILGSGGMYLAIRELVPEVRPLRCVRGLLPAALLIAVGGRLVFAWTSTLFGLLSYGLLAALLFGGTAAALDREVRSVFAEQLRSLKRFVRR